MADSEARRARHAARAGRADDPRRGRSAVVPRARLRERRAVDHGAGDRPGQADRRRSCRRSRASARAPPRRSASCSRPARSRSSRGCARSTRPRVVALLRIQGLGPKAVKRLRAELGVASIDDLRRVLAEHKLRDLKGFGAEVRGEADPVAGAPRAAGRRSGARRSRWRCRWRERIVARLAEVPGVTHASTCGSLRRFSETIGDVDILVAATRSGAGDGRGGGAAARSTACSGAATRRPASSPAAARRSTCAWWRPRQLGAALLYFTGSKGHNIKLRQRALARGLTLNEYALSEIEGGKVDRQRDRGGDLPRRSGLPFIPPVLREDAGEIEAAESGTLPRPIGRALSATSTCTRPCRATGARRWRRWSRRRIARGYRVLAVTDHAEGTLSGVGRDAFARAARAHPGAAGRSWATR